MTKTKKQLFRITHILYGGQYGIEKGYVVLSFEPSRKEYFLESGRPLHKLKLDRQFYPSKQHEEKKSEVRKNDRDYQRGDYIQFELTD